MWAVSSSYIFYNSLLSLRQIALVEMKPALLGAQSHFDGAQLFLPLPGKVEKFDEAVNAKAWLHLVA